MPKDFDRFLFRFRQFGGEQLMMAYARMGVLGTRTKALASCLMNRKSFQHPFPRRNDMNVVSLQVKFFFFLHGDNIPLIELI